MKLFLSALVALGAIGLTGCTCPQPVYNVASTGKKSDLYAAAAKTADELLTCKVLQENKATPIVLTSLVNVHKFQETSDFGRLFSETLLSEISKRGYNVIDYRGENVIIQKQQGEFYLKRNASEIKKYASALVLVGTYGKYNRGVAVNTRLLDHSNTVQSSSNIHLANSELLTMTNKDNCNYLGCCDMGGCEKPAVKKAPAEPPFFVKIVEDDCKTPSECCNKPGCVN